MARLVFLKNPLSFQKREEHELAPGRSVIDWLLEHHPPPNGCDGALRWYINGEEQTDAEGRPDLSNLDYVPEADDVVILAASPGYGIGESIITGIIVAIIVAAISITVQLLFFNKKPSVPPGFQRGDDQPNPVYDTRAQGNVARLGEPIPVVYGTVLMTPDHAMQPHRWYANNESYLDQLFVLSQGAVDVHEVLLGDTPAQMVEGGAFTYAVVPPWQHQSQPFRLGFYSDFYENVITSPEVQGIEFTGVQSSGYFRLSKTGLTGRTIMIDLAWPGGIFFQASFGGNQSPSNCSYAIHIHECHSSGTLIGLPQVHYFNENNQTNDPIRRTIYIDPGYDALWAVKVERITPQQQETTDLFQWVAAKMMATPSAPMYGDVTLLAVRVRATAGLGEGNTLVRARITRRLPVLGSGALVATQNPADALVDIYTNAVYGARRPLYEVDVAKLTQLRAAWNNYQFSAVYVSRVTVWEALTHATQGMGAAPLPVGSFLTVAQDGIKSARSMLFTEQNIVRDTFALSYEFDRPGANDGIEIEYRDAASFSPTYLRIPSNSVDPEKVALIGCVDPRHAEGYAQYLWNKKRFPRQTIEFETELEGLIPYVGERVAISHTLPRWGISGFVSKIEFGAAYAVWLDRPLPWDETPYPQMMFRTSTSGASPPVAVVRGPADNIAYMVAMPMADWHIGDRMENTHFVFGNAETVVRDFILADIRPRGGVKVGISGVIYQPTMYPGTPRFYEQSGAMSYQTYPAGFQCPQIKPYSLGVDMGLVRTPMQGGNARQRRMYRHMPTVFRLEFILQALDLGEWQSWVNRFAYDYFVIEIESMWSGSAGSIAAPHLVRFISDLEMENVTYGWVRVRVQAELSPNQWSIAGPLLPTYVWIVGGLTTSPSYPDLVIAGTATSPSGPDWITAGTPQFPAAII